MTDPSTFCILGGIISFIGGMIVMLIIAAVTDIVIAKKEHDKVRDEAS